MEPKAEPEEAPVAVVKAPELVAQQLEPVAQQLALAVALSAPAAQRPAPEEEQLGLAALPRAREAPVVVRPRRVAQVVRLAVQAARAGQRLVLAERLPRAGQVARWPEAMRSWSETIIPLATGTSFDLC